MNTKTESQFTTILKSRDENLKMKLNADNIQFLGFVYDLSNLFNLWKIAEVSVGGGWAGR